MTIYILFDKQGETEHDVTFVERSEEHGNLFKSGAIIISQATYKRLDEPEAINVAVTRAL